MSVLSYLDLSTGHISQETCNGWLKEDPQNLVIAEYEWGYFVSVPSDTADTPLEVLAQDMPEDLAKVLEYARANGCTIVRFDGAGYEMDELPTYDW